jgi:hypothetical protein
MISSTGSRHATALRVVTVALTLAAGLLASSCELTSNDLSGSLSGTVRRAGSVQVITSAIVECEGETAVSDNSGYYRMDGLPQGDAIVYASAAGYQSYSNVVNITENSTHDINMEVYVGTARLYGYVTHASLGPIEGATVTLGDLEVITDADGFYEYENILQLEYKFTITKDGYRDYTDHSLFVASEDFNHDVELKKLATITLMGVADAGLNARNVGQNTGDEPELDLYHDYAGHWAMVSAFWLDIEDSAEPVSAALKLYNVAVEGGTTRSLQVARILDPWVEMDVTWQDSLGTTGPATATQSYESRWYTVDVTSYMRDWLVYGDTNYGLWIDSPLDNDASRLLIAAREYADDTKRPRIELEYAW